MGYNPGQARDKDGKWTRSGGGKFPNGADPNRVAAGHLAAIEAEIGQHWSGTEQSMYEFNLNNVAERTRRDIGANPEVRIRVSRYVIDDILEAGEILSQHDTGSSHGWFNPEGRESWETEMFGAKETRPVYGYVHGDNPTRGATVTHYGEISVVLKPEVRDRTTMTVGDSLVSGMGMRVAPLPLKEVQTATPDRIGRAVTHYDIVRTRDVALAPRQPDYYEAQIHGPVRTSDIAKVVMTSDVSTRNPDTVSSLQKAGIPIEIIPGTLWETNFTPEVQAEEFYDAGQKRDKTGRWTSGGGGSTFPNGADPNKMAAHYTEHLGLDMTRGEWVERADGMQRLAVEFKNNIDADSSVRVRVPISVLKSVLKDGEVKTQHETGTSEGHLDPQTRKSHEYLMFGHDNTNPVYGYVLPKNKESTFNAQVGYGDVSLVLKKGVNDRTTVTRGDSLIPMMQIAPLPMKEVQSATPERVFLANTEDRAYIGRAMDKPGYYEAQIHGGVKVSDIDHIEMDTPNNRFDSDSYERQVNSVTVMADRYDITVEVVDSYYEPFVLELALMIRDVSISTPETGIWT